jgi:hypothetical protein
MKACLTEVFVEPPKSDEDDEDNNDSNVNDQSEQTVDEIKHDQIVEKDL